MTVLKHGPLEGVQVVNSNLWCKLLLFTPRNECPKSGRVVNSSPCGQDANSGVLRVKFVSLRPGRLDVMSSGEGTTKMVRWTFALKMAQAKARIWP